MKERAPFVADAFGDGLVVKARVVLDRRVVLVVALGGGTAGTSAMMSGMPDVGRSLSLGMERESGKHGLFGAERLDVGDCEDRSRGVLGMKGTKVHCFRCGYPALRIMFWQRRLCRRCFRGLPRASRRLGLCMFEQQLGLSAR